MCSPKGKRARPHFIARPMRTPRLQSCCLRRSRRVMLGFSYGRAGPSSSRCAPSWTPWAWLNSMVAFVWVKLGRGDDRGPRLPLGSPWRLLTQTEQPKSSPSFQGTARAEPATARRAKLTPRLELATACMRRRRAPEARPPRPPSERRRHRRVYPGEPPATIAITLDEAALGQSAEPHGDGALVAAGCLRPLHHTSLRMIAHSF